MAVNTAKGASRKQIGIKEMSNTHLQLGKSLLACQTVRSGAHRYTCIIWGRENILCKEIVANKKQLLPQVRTRISGL